MNIKQLEYKHIEAILAIIEQGSFDKAAWSLSYTSSAISKHIAAAEKHLGISIFKRCGRSVVTLTPEGDEIVTHLYRIKEEYDRLGHLLSDSIGNQNRLNISSLDVLAPPNLDPVLSIFRKLRPEVAVNHSLSTTTKNLEALLSGEIDLMVFMAVGNLFEDSFNSPSFQRVKHDKDFALLEGQTQYPIRIAVKKGSRSICGPVVTLEALKDETFLFKGIVPKAEDDSRYVRFINVCREHGFEPKTKYLHNIGTTIYNMVAEGEGVTLLMSKPTVQFPGVEFASLCPSPYYSHMCMAYLKSNPSKHLKTFLECAAEMPL